jgi:hypothetical protein
MLEKPTLINLLVGILLAAAPAPALTTGSSSDPDARARAVAERVLDDASRGGSAAFNLDASVFKDAHLGSAFFYYTSDSTFLGYEQAAPEHILRYTPQRTVIFPVRSNEALLGIIKVKLQSTGELFGFLGPADPGLIARLEKFSSVVGLKEGQRLSVVSTGFAGDFFVVEGESGVRSMAPASERTMRILGLKETDLEAVRFEPPDHFAPAIRKQLAEARKRAILDRRPLDDLEPLE